MSDDFATCNNCGCTDGMTESTEKLMENVANEITIYLNLGEFNGEEDKDVDFLVSKAKEILDIKNHMDKKEHKCLECGEWSTFSWKHIEYGLDD